MANVIAMKRLSCIVCTLLFGILLALSFLHLGPRLGFESQRIVLATLLLNDGSSLFVVQTRNDNLLEAYSSALYRIYPDGLTEVTGLGYEDSYWWLAKLRQSSDGKRIEIKAWGMNAGVYDPVAKITTWPGQNFPPAESHLVTGLGPKF